MAGWHDIDVPLSWQMDPEVADEPLYTNTRYALPGIDSAAALRTFPVPHDSDNPVGSYQTTFTLPKSWNKRKVLLQIDGADPLQCRRMGQWDANRLWPGLAPSPRV